MRIYFSILMAGFALAIAGPGCQFNAPKAGATTSVAAIEDITWQLVGVGGKPGEPISEDNPAASFRLEASGKRVSGYGGVNRMSGSYELNGPRLKFGILAMTRRAGPERLMQQESAMSRAMEQTASWQSYGGVEIELLDAANQSLARFKRAAK